MGGATRSFVRESPSSLAPTAIARQNDPKPRPRAPPLPHNGTHPPRKTRHPSPACRYLWMKSPESAPPAKRVPTSPAFVQPSFRGAPHTQPRSQHPVPRATKTPNSFSQLGKASLCSARPQHLRVEPHLENAARARHQCHPVEPVLERHQQLLRRPSGAQEPAALSAVLDLYVRTIGHIVSFR